MTDLFGRKARKDLNEAFKALDAAAQMIKKLEKANLRLIHQLRQMDQGFFDMSQKTSWDQMRPIFLKLQDQVQERMAIENNRICNLMITEIKDAYNEPPKQIGKVR